MLRAAVGFVLHAGVLMTKESAPRHLMKGLTYSSTKSVLAVLLLVKGTRAENLP